jgi:hypothetical protein
MPPPPPGLAWTSLGACSCAALCVHGPVRTAGCRFLLPASLHASVLCCWPLHAPVLLGVGLRLSLRGGTLRRTVRFHTMNQTILPASDIGSDHFGSSDAANQTAYNTPEWVAYLLSASFEITRIVQGPGVLHPCISCCISQFANFPFLLFHYGFLNYDSFIACLVQRTITYGMSRSLIG